MTKIVELNVGLWPDPVSILTDGSLVSVLLTLVGEDAILGAADMLTFANHTPDAVVMDQQRGDGGNGGLWDDDILDIVDAVGLLMKVLFKLPATELMVMQAVNGFP